MILRATIIDATQNERFIALVARVSHGHFDGVYSQEQDANLIRSLYSSKHMTPFEFISVTFHIECPIFVARQLMRYRCASYVERSLRYCEPIEDDVPEYRSAIAAGVKKEEARASLPLSTQTEFCMRVNVRSLFHIFDERIHPHAQKETRDLVIMMKNEFTKVYPTLSAVYEENRNA